MAEPGLSLLLGPQLCADQVARVIEMVRTAVQ